MTANRVLIPALERIPARPSGAVLVLAGEAMGTSWTVRAVGDPADGPRLTAAVREEIARVDEQMSHWRADSALSRFNAASGCEAHALPRPFAEVLGYALSLAQETDGAFDPTLGALVNLWGFGPPGPRADVPADAEIEAARTIGGWQRLQQDSDARWIQPGGLRLDLSGVAKGFAVDAVSERLTAEGAPHHLVEIGGELRGCGVKPDGRPWWVELEQPPGLDAPRMLAALHGLSVATSGDQVRVFEHDGRAFSHTLDGRTGRPVDNGVASVSVLHPSAMQADALASALTVMGPGAGMAHAEREDLAVRMILRGPAGLEERFSPALAAMLDDAE
ncbi:MAG: FAD:protein FMN transferase [Brevundimonas sp.]|uniref:FAD:protein FMN transferase n=1 Tax=Brevundimonas sp. TaxID=1871086 RepID=UPI00391B8276